MAGVLLGSVLEEAVKKLPKSLKPEAVTPALKKAGVKDEELQMSGIGVKLPEHLKASPKDDKGRVGADSIAALVNYGRDDFFTTSERSFAEGASRPGYADVVPAGVVPKAQNYKERVYNFENNNSVKDGSMHFADENYLMHTRVWDDLIDNQDTRVVGEIQSDVHQQGLTEISFKNAEPVDVSNLQEDLKTLLPRDVQRKYGLLGVDYANEIKLAAETGDDSVVRALLGMEEHYRNFSAEVLTMWRRNETTGNFMDSMDNTLAIAKGQDLFKVIPDKVFSDIADALTDGKNPIDILATAVPKNIEVPWKSSWARKGLENEIKQAIAEGKQQIAIPIRENGSFSIKATPKQVEDILAMAEKYRAEYGYGREFKRKLAEMYPNLSEDAIEYGFDDLYQAVDEFDVNEFLKLASEKAGRHGKSLEPMYRGSGVQKWYETNIDPTAEKLAKQLGTESRIVNKDGVDYRVIDLAKPGVKEKADSAFKLYAGGGALAYYMAYKQGVAEDEISSYMLEQGFSEEEIAAAKENQPKIQQALDAGVDPEMINEYLEPKQTEETKVEPPELSSLSPEKQAAMKTLVSGEMMPADELVAAMQVIKPNMSSVTTRMASFFGDESSMQEAKAAEIGMIANIQALGQKRGLNLQFEEGKWVVETPDGPVDVSPGILDTIVAEKGEMVGGIAGGWRGAVLGMGAAGPVATPWRRAGGALVGGIAGAVAGATLGTELDYMYQSMKLQEEMSAEIAAHKALTATEAAAYGEVVGLGIVKFGGKLWQGAKRVKNFVMDGNTEGARKALRDSFFLSQDEIDEIVVRFERIVDTTGMSAAEKEIKAVATSVPGAESLVKAASAKYPQASRAVVKTISDRATQLLQASDDGTTETARVLKQDLDSYVSAVKAQYDDVKIKAASNPRNKYYKFNLDNIAVKPVLESLANNITDPAIREKFILQMQQAQRYTDNRTFSDLVELRQLVNEFRFNKRITKPADFAALDTVTKGIDEKLEKGANWLFGLKGAQQWLDEFATARTDYAKMKGVQRTALYKIVNRPGVTPEAVSKAMLKYSDAIDGNYESVMSMLPKEMRQLAERDMISQLVNKYTVGYEGGIRATQFPMLAKDLSTRSFLDDESRQLVKAIDMMSDVFKNDILLGQNTGMMKVPEFQSYLTADLVVRAKFELASGIFNAIKQRIPGSKSSREIALIKNAAKFLETPLNAKSVEALKQEAAGMVTLDPLIIAAQRAQAEAIASGLDQSSTALKFSGTGKVLTHSENGSTQIMGHRIATPEIARQLAIAEGISVDSKLLDDVLRRHGYKAVQYGSNKVRLLE